MTDKAGAKGSAHDAKVQTLDDALADFTPAEIEALLERKRRAQREQFYPEQVQRMERKVEKARERLADAEAALFAAIEEQRAANASLDRTVEG